MESGAGTAVQTPRGGRRDAVWIAVGITAVALLGGFAVKDRCLRDLEPGEGGWQGQQYSRNCYSDITALYGVRGFNKNHPVAYRDTNLEYPALTGLFITAANAPVRTDCAGSGGLCGIRGFFVANAWGLAPFALFGAAALAAIGTRRWRILFFAAAPAVLAYAFHNWDLIPVGLTAVAFWAFTQRRDGLAGLLLGLGAAAKLSPGFIVPVLAIARFREDDRDATWRILAWAAAGFVIPNVVVLALAGFDGWWYPWKFQSERGANYETSWFFIQRHLGRGGGAFWDATYPKLAQWASTALFVLGAAVLLWREARRDRFRPVVVAMGVVLLFLVTAKVYSPQYALWLLPFFVLVGIPWWGYGLFVITDMLVLSAIWWFLIPLTYPGQFGAPPGVECYAFGPCADAAEHRLSVLEAAVWLRYGVLILLLWLSRRAPEHVDHSEPVFTTPAVNSA